MAHDFTQTVHGKNADEIEMKARDAVVSFFGSLDGVTWWVDTDALATLAGEVRSYVGRVTAAREIPENDGGEQP